LSNSHDALSIDAASGQGAMNPQESGLAATRQSAMTRVWNLFAFPAREGGYFGKDAPRALLSSEAVLGMTR